MKQIALTYLGRASVIPLNGKIPAIKSWKEFQTRKPTVEEVEKWWTKNPKYNIGIVTGKLSNITVVDVDQAERPTWLPKTLVVKTGKGWHYYYQYHEGMANMARVKENIDIRSEGGYVVAAGSIHPDTGKKYEVADMETIAPFPAHLFGVKKEKSNWTELAAGAPQGQRNESAAKYIGKLMQMFSQDTWENTVWETALIWNQKNNPPLSEYELRVTYNSIAGREASKPQKKEKEKTIFPIEKMDLFSYMKNNVLVYNLCLANIVRLLMNNPDFKGLFRFDSWTHKKEIKRSDGKWHEIEDGDFLDIQLKISEMYGAFRMLKREMTADAVITVCEKNKVDSALDYLNSLTWDKNERLDAWIPTVYGTEFDEYHQAVGANFFKGMVKRIIHPGCKFDTMIILQGKQGCGKSTSFSTIGKDWYLETTTRADDKDFFLQMRGKLLIEFSEGETMNRTENMKMKAILSTATDVYRAPYARETLNIPRRCVFAMTTNEERPLKDPTGNRRYYPVMVENNMVNLKWLKENRDQLFAEALYRVKVLKESVHIYSADSEDRQKDRMEHSPYEDTIREWIENPIIPYKNGLLADIRDGLTITEFWKYALKENESHLDQRRIAFIATALKQLGWESRRIEKNKQRMTKWFPDKNAIFGLSTPGDLVATPGMLVFPDLSGK